MSSNLSLNTANLYRPFMLNKKSSASEEITGKNNDNAQSDSLTPMNGEDLLLNSLYAIASQNGYENPALTNKKPANTEQVAEMLKAGNKQEVKDEMGADAVPALVSIVKDTSQPMQVRIDAIATLAKLVDEGKAPASCLVNLLKDPNCKDMAERAMANVGEEIMPVVKQLLNSGDPQLKASATNILQDMVDAWTGYENDPKWGAEAQKVIPQAQALLNRTNNVNNQQVASEDSNT